MAFIRCIGSNGGEVVVVPIPVTSQMVTASSTVGQNFEGYRAFDSQSCNLSTLQGGWLAGASDSTPTLTVNFGEAKKLGRISIETANNNNPDTTRAVYIEGSSDGSTWENILASGDTASLVFEVGKYREYSFDLNEGEYQYFRIRGTQPFFGGSFQYACSFSEITIYDKSSGSGGGLTPIPLIDEAVWIATDATHRTKTPIDANNYIDISDNTATLHRTNSSYALVVRLPDLQAGHTYLFGFDSVTNSDNSFYVGQVTSLTDTTMTDTRIMTADNRNTALKITPSTSSDYSVMIWSGNTSNIVITSPYLIDLGSAI